MAEDPVVGASDLLTVYRIFEKVDGHCSGYPPLTIDKYLTKPFHNYGKRQFLPLFTHGEVLSHGTAEFHLAQSKNAKSSETGFKIGAGAGETKVGLQASRNTLSTVSSTVAQENGKTVLYKLLITSDMIKNKRDNIWGSTFQDLLKTLETGVNLSEALQLFYDRAGTHFVHTVEVGCVRGSRSEHHQSSKDKGNTESVALATSGVGNLSINRSNNMEIDSMVDFTGRYEQGNGLQPIVFMKHMTPLWTLEPLRDMENIVGKMKGHFFHELDMQRLCWRPRVQYRNFNESEVGARANVCDADKDFTLLIIDDDLAVEHESTVRAFRCKVVDDCERVRFQLWEPKTRSINDDSREYRLHWSMEVNLVRDTDEYMIGEQEKPIIRPGYVVGIAIPSKVAGQFFRPKKRLRACPISFKGVQPAADNVCWILVRDKNSNAMMECNDWGKFKRAKIEEIGTTSPTLLRRIEREALVSVPLVGLDLDPSDISYYKHMIRNDPKSGIRVTFGKMFSYSSFANCTYYIVVLITVPFKLLSDDPYFDELVNLVDWGNKTLIDGVRSRAEELIKAMKEELAATENQTAQGEVSVNNLFNSALDRLGGGVQQLFSIFSIPYQSSA